MTGVHIEVPGEPDFAAILGLARRRAEETRREYREMIMVLFETRRTLLTDRQRALLNNLLRQLVHDIEASLHQLLMARLDGETWVAREAIETVHRGQSAGTVERLAAAGMLSDLTLIEAVTHRLYEHQLDRALNHSASQGWSGAVGPEYENAPAALLPIADRSVQDRLEAYAVERSLRTDPYGNPVIDTAELEPELHARLHWMVAAVLRETLLTFAPRRQSEIDILVEETVTAALGKVAARAASGTRAAAVAEAVEAVGRLDCAVAIEALRRGEIPLFEALLFRLTRLRPVLVRRLLYEPGGEGLAVAGRAIGMRRDEFAELYTLTRAARSVTTGENGAATARALSFFDRIPEVQAALVHDYWQRSPELLTALRSLQTDRDRGVAQNA